MIATGFFWLTRSVDYTPLAETIHRHVAQPKVLVISWNLALGHPLVRQVGGKWAQRVGSLWITESAEMLLETEKSPETAARLAQYVARDRRMLLEDIDREKPDIILLDGDWEERVRADVALAERLGAYSEIGRVQKIIIFQRRSRD
jgi:hypothetical protein